MNADLAEIFTWARMKFKPAKSRSLVIKNGKPKIIFKIDGNPIPTVKDKPIKCLGKWFTFDGRTQLWYMTCLIKWRPGLRKSI